MHIYAFINQSINTLSKRKDNQMLCADCAKYGCEFSSYSSFQKPQTQKQPSGEGRELLDIIGEILSRDELFPPNTLQMISFIFLQISNEPFQKKQIREFRTILLKYTS